MKNLKFRVLALVLCLSLFVLSGCTSDTDRVQEALNKMEGADAISVKGNMTGSIDAGKLGTTDIELHFGIKITDKGSCISMQISTDASSISMEEDIYMQQYIVGDRVYIYCPQLTSQYIDCSSEYQQITDEGIGTIMAALDFDAGSTQLEYGDTTINYQGNETNVLMVMVQLKMMNNCQI